MAAIRRKRFTARPAGGAGTAVYTEQFQTGRPGVVRFAAIDYGSGVPATTDLIIKRDSASGAAILTRSNSATDVAPVAVGTTALDEAQNAVSAFTSATDAASGGLPFTSGLYLDVAQADPYADATDEILVDILWEPIRKKTFTLTSDGSGNATSQWTYGRPGAIRFIQIDYDASPGAGFTLVIKRDTSTGATIFTKDANETDFGPSAVGTVGADETFAASAASDGMAGGLPFNTGLYIDTTGGNSGDVTAVSIWYDA